MRPLYIWLFLLLTACSAREDSLTVTFSGDLLLDRGVRHEISMNGPEAIFSGAADVIGEADFHFVNLECPVTDILSPVNKQFIFRGDPQILPLMRQAGFTHAILANNHSYDQGRDGLLSTAENLGKNDIIPVGFGANACEPVLIVKNGIRIAVFSSVLVPLENWMHLPDRPSICQMQGEALTDAIRNYSDAHPDAHIIVSLHWGTEYQPAPAQAQRILARQLVAAGADAIIGHHPHVVQSVEVYRGKPILYSIGNFIFDLNQFHADQGVTARLTFNASGIIHTQLIPYSIRNCIPTPIHPPADSSFFNRVQSFSFSTKLIHHENGWTIPPDHQASN